VAEPDTLPQVSQLSIPVSSFYVPISTLDVDREADVTSARPVDYDADELPFSMLVGADLKFCLIF